MKGKPEIRTFIQNLLVNRGDERQFTDQESLFESGRLQSIDAVDLVVFLEDNFGIDFATIGFDRNQIDTIDQICALTAGTTSHEG